jgi:hypothetical protein
MKNISTGVTENARRHLTRYAVADLQRQLRRLVWLTLLVATGNLAFAQTVVDASTLNNKVMAGYQGWFMTSGDGSGANWRHWAPSTPSASNVTFDMWPDMRELAASELTATNFKYANGNTAGLYSAYNATTVDRHVKWMQDYGIDGVFVQRFIGEAVNMRSVRDKVLQNVRYGSEKHGRIFANMYDISGGNANTLVNDIKNDWMHLVDDLTVTSSNRYARHNGMPVVSIWGFGFSDRPGTVAQLNELMQWFKSGAAAKYRASVMLGVDSNWRSHSTAWQSAYKSAAIVSPWSVGRYSDDSGADNFRSGKIAPDLATLSGTGAAYMPVVWPGFSWYNLRKGASPFNQIPRRGGRFFWRQAYNAISAGSKMVYVAMFDEMDEGTAMFKIAENASQIPSGSKFLTLNADGENLPSDWYLRLMGEASKMLRGERALTSTMPTSIVVTPPSGGGTTPATGASTMSAGQQINSDQYLSSSNKAYKFILQADGNIVLYNASNQVRWSSDTQGKGGTKLVLQSDGNLVLYTASGTPVWSSGTNGSAASKLAILDNGNVVLTTTSNTVLWSTNTATVPSADTTKPTITLSGSASMTVAQGSVFSDPGATATDNVDGNVTAKIVKSGNVNTGATGVYTLSYDVKDAAGNAATTVTRTVTVTSSGASGGLSVGQQLNANQSLSSPSGQYKLYLQSDGNVVLRNAAGAALWSSGTNGKGGTRLVLQSDGNLVLYTASGSAVWATGTNGKGGTRLLVQDDGKLVLRTASGSVVWSS